MVWRLQIIDGTRCIWNSYFNAVKGYIIFSDLKEPQLHCTCTLSFVIWPNFRLISIAISKNKYTLGLQHTISNDEYINVQSFLGLLCLFNPPGFALSQVVWPENHDLLLVSTLTWIKKIKEKKTFRFMTSQLHKLLRVNENKVVFRSGGEITL